MKITHSIAIRVIRLLTVACLIVTPLTAQAAVDMFLKLTGIEGESKDLVHANEIEILSWSESTSASSSIISGGGVPKVDFDGLSVTKLIDASSPALRLKLAQGGVITEAKLTVRKVGESPLEFFVIDMTDVLVQSVSAGGSGGEDRLIETVTFLFTTIKWTYTPQKDDGSAGSTKEAGWNLLFNTPLQ